MRIGNKVLTKNNDSLLLKSAGPPSGAQSAVWERRAAPQSRTGEGTAQGHQRFTERGLLRQGQMARLEVLKEVVPFVVDDDEGGEVFDLDLPDGFHPEFFEL